MTKKMCIQFTDGQFQLTDNLLGLIIEFLMLSKIGTTAYGSRFGNKKGPLTRPLDLRAFKRSLLFDTSQRNFFSTYRMAQVSLTITYWQQKVPLPYPN